MSCFHTCATLLLLSIITGNCCLATMVTDNSRHQYCIVGAGPGGLQLAHDMERAGRDYVVIERGPRAGTFFEKYPIHRQLISVNKISSEKGHAGDTDFNLRFDWNSLLTDDLSMRFREFSEEYYPHADSMCTYLQRWADHFRLKVEYERNVTSIDRPSGGTFTITALDGVGVSHNYHCDVAVVATGRSLSTLPPKMFGAEETIDYGDMSSDGKTYENERILVLGNGNSANEVAGSLFPWAHSTDVLGRRPMRFAINTHYVGDVRTINSLAAENYVLKLSETFNEVDLDNLLILKLPSGRKLVVVHSEAASTGEGNDVPVNQQLILTLKRLGEDTESDTAVRWIQHWTKIIPQILPNSGAIFAQSVRCGALRKPYHTIIRALGFRADMSVFKGMTVDKDDGTVYREEDSSYPGGAFPRMGPLFESKGVDGLYYAGALMHGRDYRRSSGGFIHGFRYLCRSLFHHLEERYHGVEWPSLPSDITTHKPGGLGLTEKILGRLDQTSALFQMFGVLCDVIAFNCDGSYQWYREVPHDAIHLIQTMNNHSRFSGHYITVHLNFHPNFTLPGSDSFRSRRSGHHLRGDGAADALPLHPIVRYYDRRATLSSAGAWDRPAMEHHMYDDLHNEWSSEQRHMIPLLNWLKLAVFPDMATGDGCISENQLWTSKYDLTNSEDTAELEAATKEQELSRRIAKKFWDMRQTQRLSKALALEHRRAADVLYEKRARLYDAVRASVGSFESGGSAHNGGGGGGRHMRATGPIDEL